MGDGGLITGLVVVGVGVLVIRVGVMVAVFVVVTTNRGVGGDVTGIRKDGR